MRLHLPFGARSHRECAPKARGLPKSGMALTIPVGSVTALLMFMSVVVLAANIPTSYSSGSLPQQAAGLFPVPLVDSSRFAKAAGNCVALHENMQACEHLLKIALAANSRQTDARLWLAFLAEHAGRNADAEVLYLQSLQRDHSFYPLWAYWSFLQRTGADLRARDLDRQVLLRATPSFRAHYSALWRSGWTPKQTFEVLLEEKQSAQLASLVDYLIDSRNPSARLLLSRLLSARGDLSLPLPKLREFVLQLVAQGIEGNLPLPEAEKVWRQAISEPTSIDESIPILGDKRESPTDDPVWNYNPTLRLPFVPKSFDWSAIRSEDGESERLSHQHGGIRIQVRGNASNGQALLAKLAPIRAGMSTLRFTIEWDESFRVRCPSSYFWELRDRDGVEVVARARAYSKSHTSLGWTPITEQQLPIHGTYECLQLMLFRAPQEGGACLPDEIAIRRVRISDSENRETEDAVQ